MRIDHNNRRGDRHRPFNAPKPYTGGFNKIQIERWKWNLNSTIKNKRKMAIFVGKSCRPSFWIYIWSTDVNQIRKCFLANLLTHSNETRIDGIVGEKCGPTTEFSFPNFSLVRFQQKVRASPNHRASNFFFLCFATARLSLRKAGESLCTNSMSKNDNFLSY